MSARRPRLRWRPFGGHGMYWAAIYIGKRKPRRREILALEVDGSDWRVDRSEQALDEPALASGRSVVRTTRAAKLAAEDAASALLKQATAALGAS